MTAIALPLYSGPLQGMMRLGLMFEHGNSAGAAFALFELGIGINLGRIAWLMTLFRRRRVLAWLGLVAAATLVLADAVSRPLDFAAEQASHTHAFDEWTSLFASDSAVEWPTVRDRLLQKVEILEPLSLGGLAFPMLTRLALRRFDPRGGVEAYLVRQPSRSDRPWRCGTATCRGRCSV